MGKLTSKLIMIMTVVAITAAASAQERLTRLLRQPDIHGDTDRLRLRRRLWVVAAEGGDARRLTSDDGMEYFPEVLARRPLDRLHRRVHRQAPGVRHQRGRRRAAPAHLLQRRRPAPAARRHRQPRPRLDAGRQEHPLPPAPPALERPHGPAVLRARRRGHGDAAGDPRRRRRRVLAGREEARLHADRARVPHLEALPRRARAGRLDLRPRGEQGRADHRQSVHRQPARVDRRHDLLHLRPRGRTPEPLVVRPEVEAEPQGHDTRRLRRPLAERRQVAGRLRERRVHLPLRRRDAEERARAHPRLRRLPQHPAVLTAA